MVAAHSHKRPRRRANAPGPGTEDKALDAPLIVARSAWSRTLSRSRVWLRRPWREEPAMSLLTISRKERDALYELVVNHLSAIGDVWVEFQRPARTLGHSPWCGSGRSVERWSMFARGS